MWTAEDYVLEHLKKSGSVSVVVLREALRSKNSSMSDAELVDLIWRLKESGRIDLHDLPCQPCSIMDYLRKWERTLWFYLCLIVCIATLLVVFLVPPVFPFVVFRWVLGFLFVLILPGYLFLELLFPKPEQLDALERLGLSIVVCVTIVPLVLLLLNYSSWGIRLDPIMISLSLVSIGLAIAAVIRQWTLANVP